MTKNLWIGFILIFIVMLPLYAVAKPWHKPMGYHEVPVVSFDKDALFIQRKEGKPIVLEVEIARTSQQLRQGLMYRESLAKDTGMLFLLPKERKMTMWMKNTYIPLDMLFINKEGVIIDIKRDAEPESLQYLSSHAPVIAVLEVNGGYAAKMGIALGDKVRYQALGS